MSEEEPKKGMKIRGLIGVEVREIEAEPNQRSPEISLPLAVHRQALSLSAIRKHLGVNSAHKRNGCKSIGFPYLTTKGQGPIVGLTAYDAIMGRAVAESGVDFLLVGDSVGTTFGL